MMAERRSTQGPKRKADAPEIKQGQVADFLWLLPSALPTRRGGRR